MAYVTLSSGLTIKVPTDGTQNWGPTMRTDTFQKISEHDHTGSGKGLQIGTTAIVDAAITASKLGTNSVSTVKIQDSAVTTAKILNSNVTAAKLASDAVTTVKILDANVTGAKLESGINIPYSKSAAVAAAGADQAGATQITAQIVNVSSGSGGVKLPTPSTHDICFLYNTGGGALNLYPQSGGTINSLSANTAISVASGHGAFCFAYASTAWVVLVV